MAQSEYFILPDLLLHQFILPRLDSFDILRLVLTCKAFREFQKRTNIPLRTKITDVLKGTDIEYRPVNNAPLVNELGSALISVYTHVYVCGELQFTGSWTSILWAKTWCDEFPWSPKLIPTSARVSSLRVVQLLNQQFEIQRPLLGRIGYEAAQVDRSIHSFGFHCTDRNRCFTIFSPILVLCRC